MVLSNTIFGNSMRKGWRVCVARAVARFGGLVAGGFGGGARPAGTVAVQRQSLPP